MRTATCSSSPPTAYAWDKVGVQEAVDVARPLCCTGGQLELAASRGSTDDITVLIVSFSAMNDGLYLYISTII